jgi:hypothetical protein
MPLDFLIADRQNVVKITINVNFFWLLLTTPHHRGSVTANIWCQQFKFGHFDGRQFGSRQNDVAPTRTCAARCARKRAFNLWSSTLVVDTMTTAQRCHCVGDSFLECFRVGTVCTSFLRKPLIDFFSSTLNFLKPFNQEKLNRAKVF